jgi:hypothetical protein
MAIVLEIFSTASARRTPYVVGAAAALGMAVPPAAEATGAGCAAAAAAEVTVAGAAAA